MMALMKKDFYLLGKQVWVLIASALVLSFVPRLEYFGNSYLATLTMITPLTTLYHDERCRWDAYLAMTPCRPEKVVLSKYLFAASLALTALILIFLLSCVRATVTGAEYNLAAALSPLAMSVTVNAIILPAAFRFGAEKGRLTLIAMMFITFAVLMGWAALAGAGNMLKQIERIPFAAAAAVMAAVNIVSFFLSARFYKRRLSGAYPT